MDNNNKAITKIFITGQEHNIGLEEVQISKQLDTRFVLRSQYEFNNTLTNENITKASKEVSDINIKLNTTYKQEIFDMVHPEGEIYVQFPGQSDPDRLYNKGGIVSIWNIVDDYDGAFFRSEGKDANGFIERGSLSPQEATVGTHNHTGTVTIQIDGGHTHKYDKTDILENINIYYNPASTKKTVIQSKYYEDVTEKKGAHSHQNSTITIDNNADNQENRPKNYTIRIWKRIN